MKGFKSGDKVFCSYINDNKNTSSGYFVLIELKNNFVILRGTTNQILIPISQILKLKKAVKNG